MLCRWILLWTTMCLAVRKHIFTEWEEPPEQEGDNFLFVLSPCSFVVTGSVSSTSCLALIWFRLVLLLEDMAPKTLTLCLRYGSALTFVSQTQLKRLKAIEAVTGKQMDEQQASEMMGARGRSIRLWNCSWGSEVCGVVFNDLFSSLVHSQFPFLWLCKDVCPFRWTIRWCPSTWRKYWWVREKQSSLSINRTLERKRTFSWGRTSSWEEWNLNRSTQLMSLISLVIVGMRMIPLYVKRENQKYKEFMVLCGPPGYTICWCCVPGVQYATDLGWSRSGTKKESSRG